MAANINRVLLAGNLTRDPQVRFLANERAVADFGLAMNRRYRGADGEMKEDTTFVDIEAWGRTAELVGQYLTKGRSCFVEGRLRLDQWEDKSTGQKRNKLKVVADNVQFLDSRGDGGGGGGGGGYSRQAPQPSAAEPDYGPPDGGPPPAGGPPPLGDDEPPF